jgi:hypothetical protein
VTAIVFLGRVFVSWRWIEGTRRGRDRNVQLYDASSPILEMGTQRDEKARSHEMHQAKEQMDNRRRRGRKGKTGDVGNV